MGLRVIFFGMAGNFSVPPLAGLIATDSVEIVAVVTLPQQPAAATRPRRLDPPRPAPSDLPILNPYLDQNIWHLAWSHCIPVWEVGKLTEQPALQLLASLRPDLLVVACFSQRLPPTLLQLPRFGCLNLHPSLLPAYRGPTPLFWQARQGEAQAGVTLHFLDEGLDTGDLVAQTAWAWPVGATEAELESQCAEAGTGLLLEAVQQLGRERALPRRPQPAGQGSYFPWPATESASG